MGRRFPTPIIGVPTNERRYRAVGAVVADSSEPIEWSTFQKQCRDLIRNPETGDMYSKSYMRRILSTYAEIGVVDRNDDLVEPSPFVEDWFSGQLAFEEFLWKCVKRSWVAMGKKPEGIEGLDRILHVLEGADGGKSSGEIRSVLASDYDYEFNNEGIRGYPDLLELLGVVQQDDSGVYHLESEDVVARFKRRFRKADIFGTLESRLKREGSTVTPPDYTAKRDLMKYYMYRESGGWNKRRGWFQTFWRDYLKSETREGETGSELRRSEKYRSATNRKRSLREEILTRFESFESQDLRGLSASVLERIADADSEQHARHIQVSAGSGISEAELELLSSDTRDPYTFPQEFALYDWQSEAVEAWFNGDKTRDPETGITQVVTGAGKTVMALETVRRWLAEDPADDRVVTVVVPTRVLMRQWLTEFVSKLNVPVADLGWAGGGHKNDFSDCRILVSIVNSAVKDDFLKKALTDVSSPEHLLVADECHRYTGDKFSNIFSYPRTASLGLSATPVSREDDRTESDKLLLNELGEIYYNLTYDEGIERGLIPEFTVEYIGFELADPERREYEKLSQKVSNAVKDIKQRYGHRLHELPGGFSQQLQIIRKNTDGPTGAISDYFRYTQERRELVANAVARQAITLQLLQNAIETDQKTIVFQERIDQLEQLISPWEHRGVNARTGELADDADNYRQRLYNTFDGLEQVDKAIEELFGRSDYWPVMYHSRHSREVWNDIAMDWFREDNMANVMLSVKALIEGVDVPSADIGIVRVSSSSIRQRIQTLGRILRTGEDAQQESTLYVLYARDTVDERIFEEYDWKKELASAKIKHKIWQRDDETDYASGHIRPAEKGELPPRPEPEQVPDPDDLDIGDPYEGPRGPVKRISVDSRRQLFEKTQNGRQYLNTEGFEDLIDFVHKEKGGGTVIINEHNHLLTVLDDGPVFLGTIEDLDQLDEVDSNSPGLVDPGNSQEADTDSSQSLTDEPDDFEDLFGP